MTGRLTGAFPPLSSFRSLSFRRKVTIGFAIAAVLVLLVTAISAIALRMALDSDREAFRQAEELIRVGDLRAALERRVSSYRGYLVTGQMHFLVRLQNARSDFAARLLRLRRGAESEDLRVLDLLGRANRDYEKAIAAGIRLRQEGATADVLGRYIETVSGPRRDALEKALDNLLAHRRRIARETERTASQENLWSSILIFASGGAALLLLIALSVPVTRTLASLYDTERLARARAEAAERRSSFLAKASGVLASSLDYRATLASVARLAVPEMGDWCIVDVADAEGRLQRLAVHHADPSKVEVLRTLWELYPEEPKQPYGSGKVFATGEAEVSPEITDEMLHSFARDEPHYAILRDLGFKSYMSLPLSVRGRTIGVLSFAAAESDIRYREEDLEFGRHLARRASLAIDNAGLFREAREAVGARDDFLSIASHELKTPVTTLQLQIQSLLRRAEVDPSHAAQASVERLAAADRQVIRLTKLINELLDISRITGKGLELELEPVDLAAVVRDVVARNDEELKRARCQIRLELEPSPSGTWDRMRVEQIVTNFLSNAIKYGAGRPIDIRVDGDENAARLTVRDRGIGIRPEHQVRIFQRFERAVSKSDYGGFGLGLWIVRQIVDAHGGEIHVTSAPGQGSAFTVELPRSPKSPGSPDGPGGGRILIDPGRAQQ
jgi:signal transduction histidine kinase/CHASE3 domain sensor protein